MPGAIAYLVGYRSFYGLDINVDHHVLIPRPETEQLVDRVLDRIQYLVSCGRKPTVADIGTGSGAVAVAVALNAPGVPVYAVDISDAALAVANQNVWRYGLSEQVQCIPGNLLEALPGPVDIIVANLPYVATADLATLSRQVRDYEPHVALDGGPDGLQVIRSLFDELVRGAASKLRHDGRIYLEIGHDQGRAVQQLAELALPGCAMEILTDLAGLDRIVVISQ